MSTNEQYKGHTPGPWEIILDPEGWELLADGRGFTICTFDCEEPNARLIADAPKLLAQRNELAAALRVMVAQYERISPYLGSDPGQRDQDIAHARAVLAKIEK